MVAHTLPRPPASLRPATIVLRGLGAVRSSMSWFARRADSHPDAPARRPIRAHADLGAPLMAAVNDAGAWMSPPPERRLPRDLNLPLSAFDPGAIRAAAPLPVRAAGFADPVQLERTLQRLSATL